MPNFHLTRHGSRSSRRLQAGLAALVSLELAGVVVGAFAAGIEQRPMVRAAYTGVPIPSLAMRFRLSAYCALFSPILRSKNQVMHNRRSVA